MEHPVLCFATNVNLELGETQYTQLYSTIYFVSDGNRLLPTCRQQRSQLRSYLIEGQLHRTSGGFFRFIRQHPLNFLPDQHSDLSSAVKLESNCTSRWAHDLNM